MSQQSHSRHKREREDTRLGLNGCWARLRSHALHVNTSEHRNCTRGSSKIDVRTTSGRCGSQAGALATRGNGGISQREFEAAYAFYGSKAQSIAELLAQPAPLERTLPALAASRALSGDGGALHGAARRLTRKDARWLKTLRYANAGRGGANRLRRGHRFLWKRRWEGALQATVDREREKGLGRTPHRSRAGLSGPRVPLC